VRVRDHIFLSTTAAALLAPTLGLRAVGVWAGGVLIDVDHYLWFCVRHHDLSVAAAMRFFDGAHPPQTRPTRILHHPMTVLSVLIVASRQRWLRPLAIGMSLHVGLDKQYERRMKRARAQALERDRFSCQACGARTTQIDTHLFHQPPVLPSYRSRNLVSLCPPCHDVVHASPVVSTWS
jgi:hypothetical protein